MTIHSLFPVTLVKNEKLKPRLQRLTFTSPVFADYEIDGPDEYFGLLMPPKHEPFESFSLNGLNIRAAVASLPESQRPELRWYTIRRLNRASQTIDVDVVTHGDNGPGSRWIQRAKPGDTAGVFTCPALWVPPTHSQLLVADSSAVPALRHILEYQRERSPEALGQVDVCVVISNSDEVEDGFAEMWQPHVRSLAIVRTRFGDEASEVMRVLRRHYIAREVPQSVWVSGEGDLTKAVRRMAINDWGVPSEDIVWVPFWFRGRARP